MDRRLALARLGLAAAPLCGAALPCPIWAAASAKLAHAGNASMPDWVPSPGTRRNISLNMQADVDPCPARNCIYSGIIGQRAVIEAWCGAAFATDYGRLGAWITTGGGHGDYYGNEVYAFELDSRRWVRLSDPYPGGADSTVDYDEGEYAPGIPLSSHTYQHTQYIPAAQGGGQKGSLLIVVAYAAGRMARGSGRAHAFDLATKRWERYSRNKATIATSSMSATTYDARRAAFWRVPYGGAQIEYLSTTDRLFRVLSPGWRGGNNFGLDHVCAHDPVHDLLLVLDWPPRAPAGVFALDLANPTAWRALTVSGSVPGPETRGMSIDWCPTLHCLVAYEGGRADYVRKLLPPVSNVLTTPWRWEIESFSGDEPVGRKSGLKSSYSRFRWAPEISSFVWADARSLPVQVWRLRGT